LLAVERGAPSFFFIAGLARPPYFKKPCKSALAPQETLSFKYLDCFSLKEKMLLKTEKHFLKCFIEYAVMLAALKT
jgi:hypothetical protein